MLFVKPVQWGRYFLSQPWWGREIPSLVIPHAGRQIKHGILYTVCRAYCSTARLLSSNSLCFNSLSHGQVIHKEHVSARLSMFVPPHKACLLCHVCIGPNLKFFHCAIPPLSATTSHRYFFSQTNCLVHSISFLGHVCLQVRGSVVSICSLVLS